MKCKALEDLSEHLAPSNTPEARRIVLLATLIWTSSTAVEVLGFAEEVLPPSEFSDLSLWVRGYYPLIFAAYQGKQHISDWATCSVQ